MTKIKLTSYSREEAYLHPQLHANQHRDYYSGKLQ